MKKNKQQNRVVVNRSLEGNIFEAVVAILVVVMWVIALRLGISMPDAASVSSSLGGTTDTPAPASFLYFMAAVGTIVAAVALCAAYHPDTMVNVPGKIHSLRGYAMATRMVRIMSVEITLMFIGIIFESTFTQLSPALTILSTFVVVCTAILFTVLINRAK